MISHKFHLLKLHLPHHQVDSQYYPIQQKLEVKEEEEGGVNPHLVQKFHLLKLLLRDHLVDSQDCLISRELELKEEKEDGPNLYQT